VPGAEAPTLARARVLDAAGALALYQGDLSATRALLKDSLALYRQHRHQSGVAWVLFHLGWMCHDHYLERVARRFLNESLALFRELEDRRGVARALNALGLVEMVAGDITLACALHEESLALSRQVGDRWAIAWALSNLGVDLVTLAKLDRGDIHSAQPLFEEGLRIWHELGERRHLAFTQMNMADCAIQARDFHQASQLLEQSLTLFTDLDDVNVLFFAVSVGSSLVWALQRYEPAVRLIGATYGRAKARTGRMYPLKESMTLERLDTARGILGGEAYERAWIAGCAMTLPEAAAYFRQQSTAMSRELSSTL
jgi:tetratricopeptide (TPR) repeat protein